MTKNVGDTSTFKNKVICVGKCKNASLAYTQLLFQKMCMYLACGHVTAQAPFLTICLGEIKVVLLVLQ